MSPRLSTTLRLDEDLRAGLQELKERDGIPVSEQVRRAIQAWLEAKGISKTERKRVAPRKRS